MRKNLLALSIAAMVGGLSGAANAAVINDPAVTTTTLAPTTTGVGHILVVPYFNTQGSFKSLLNIVNTDTVNGKAVKLRYRGAANSDDLFDITVFLSPGDMWTANVSADADGFSRLETNDTSCTLPSIADIKADSNGRFKTNRVRGGLASETREGYIEILNTADIPPATTGLFPAIKHVAGKAPCTAAVMDLQETDLADLADANDRGYDFPTGGLAANWVLVNVEGAASHSGNAYAVRAQDTTTGANAAGNIVWFPQTTAAPTYPATGDVTWFTADPLLASTGFASQVANYDFPDLSTPYTTAVGASAAATQADELTRALATASVSNEYLTASGFGTDWVFSMPTRRYHVAMNYAASGAARVLFRGATTAAPAGTSAWFTPGNTSISADANLICVTPGSMRGYDREETTQSTFVISPSQGLKLCGETSVLSFNNTGASVLGAQIARNNVATRYAEGWLNIATPAAASTVTIGGTALSTIGLPVIGFAAAKVNGNNLGGTWEHRYSR
ncbi:cell surface protein [Pulveribacter sp.]|uniref:cell surface protein n=1 Tax=Pulveribacter sp. TaxID=2678893 RepID=UPI0028AC205A|nr:cell surface protein [Pulveribacter sp.]